MKTGFLALLLSLLVLPTVSAVDVGIGIPFSSGAVFQHSLEAQDINFHHSDGVGLFVEVGLSPVFAFVFDGNVAFNYKRHGIRGGDISFLNKFRFGNSFRYVMAIGPSTMFTTYNFDGAKELRPHWGLLFTNGFELDLGPGYFFIDLKYGAYLDAKSVRAAVKIKKTQQQMSTNKLIYSITGQVSLGYAIRFGTRGN